MNINYLIFSAADRHVGAEGDSSLLSDAVVALSEGMSEKELLESGKYPEDIVKKASKLMLIVK